MKDKGGSTILVGIEVGFDFHMDIVMKDKERDILYSIFFSDIENSDKEYYKSKIVLVMVHDRINNIVGYSLDDSDYIKKLVYTFEYEFIYKLKK